MLVGKYVRIRKCRKHTNKSLKLECEQTSKMKSDKQKQKLS
jgi:hypothetical protein